MPVLPTPNQLRGSLALIIADLDLGRLDDPSHLRNRLYELLCEVTDLEDMRSLRDRKNELFRFLGAQRVTFDPDKPEVGLALLKAFQAHGSDILSEFGIAQMDACLRDISVADKINGCYSL